MKRSIPLVVALTVACHHPGPASAPLVVPPTLADDPGAAAEAVARDLAAAFAAGETERVLQIFDQPSPDVVGWIRAVIADRLDPIDVTVTPTAVAGDGLIVQVSFFTPRLRSARGHALYGPDRLYLARAPGGHLAIHRAPPAGVAPVRTPAIERERVESWRRDVRLLAAELPRRHVNLFFQLPRARWARAFQELEADLPRLADHQVKVRLQQAVALVGDTHTRLSAELRSVPLDLQWFSDGIAVTRASDASLLGARLVRVGLRPVDEAVTRVRSLFAADNPSGVREEVPPLLLSPEVLHAVGLSDTPRRATYTFAPAAGPAVTVTLSVDDRIRPTGPDRRPPLRQHHPDQPFWFDLLAEGRVLYLKYDRCAHADRFRALCGEMFGAVDRGEVKRVVVDLRDNGGGDSGVFRPFLDGLGARSGRFRVYALIGRKTFSSAMWNAIELRHETHAVLVGEETAGKPNAYGEVRTLRLPGSGLMVQYSTRYWRRDPTSDGPSLAPDLPVAASSADFLAGRDPALETALYR
jgi:hypothetical protein